MAGFGIPPRQRAMLVTCQESMPSAQERGKKMRRKRFQKGSLQTHKSGQHRVWVGFWYDGGGRRSKTLGRCSQMTKGEAEAALSEILRPINLGVSRGPRPVYMFREFVETQYLPFNRRGWKESTAGTSEQIVTTHLIPAFGDRLLQTIKREDLQNLLDEKAKKLSHSPVAHIRWFMNAIFKLAVSDGCIASNPAAELIIPRKCQPGREMRPLTEEEVYK